MGRFNLLDEPWIAVLDGGSGGKKDVSMSEFFQNAEKYQTLAGEMETQNFAVMRFLLAVVQTVFSRFDFQGEVLPGVHLGERWVQTEPVDEDDWQDYCAAADECWDQLYRNGSFPNIVTDYLEKWRDRFFLFDDKHPFYQVNQREMDEIMEQIPKRSQPTSIFGKNLNRTISESENKTALFSPIANRGNEKRGRKDVLTEAELVRWLLMFQGYSGLADKTSLVRADQRPSKGWLFDLGGIFLQGSNAFETIVMNYIPESSENIQNFVGSIQKPCWESEGSRVVQRLCTRNTIDNLAELYTNWSRAICIDPNTKMEDPLEIHVVKLPEIDHTEHSIEPMTLWRINNSGPNKNHSIPRKHTAGQALWRSFGIISIKPSAEDGGNAPQPGIFSQYQRLVQSVGSRWTDLVGISMEDDGNATSWVPADEIADRFQINDLVITDNNPDGWVIRINDAVETTKEVVSVIFKGYLRGICEIRNIKVTNPMDPIAVGFIDRELARMYAVIDFDFKNWLSSIKPDDSKEEKIKLWYAKLKKAVLAQGEELFENSTARDLTGIEKETGIENIATKYWQFVGRVNKKLGEGGTH